MPTDIAAVLGENNDPATLMPMLFAAATPLAIEGIVDHFSAFVHLNSLTN